MTDAIESADRQLLARGRALFGVTGAFEYGPLRETLRASQLSIGPAVAVAARAAVALFAIVAVWNVEGAMGTSFGGYERQVELIVVVAFAIGAIAGPRVAARVESRVRLMTVLTFVSGAALVGAAFGAYVAVLLWLTVAAAAGGLVHALLLPVLCDVYPPEARGRVMSVYAAGVVAAPAAAAALLAATETMGLSWRVVLLVLGALGLAAGAVPVGGDPRPGRWDEVALAGEAHRIEGGLDPARDRDERVEIGTAEQFRRVMSGGTTTPLLLVVVGFGMFAVPAQRYVGTFFRDELSVPLVTWERLSTIGWIGGFLGAAYVARRAEIAFRASPARLLQLLSWLGTFAAAALSLLAISGDRTLATILLGLCAGAFAAQLACAVFAVLGLAHPHRRTYAAALLALAFVVGAQFGPLLLDTIGSRFGASWALVTAAAYTLYVARVVAAALTDAPRDLDAVITSVVEEESLRAIVSQGTHVPLLACRGIDFSYGQLQVLFGVDFTVDDGEMVALLGTNGAGKSTLLRVISGLGLPSAGTVRLRGNDISFAATDRRVQLGISQIPGGKAVFGPMTVAENLAVYGYSHGRDKAAVTRGVDTTFEAFPRLAERRNQLASTLSGGEQQMLALGKAFILRPQLLLIDELSLGLAPIVVGELLQMVRQINATGTAVVLVEQSVNIALSLVHHAYFMEKGQIRFDGRAADLMGRPDLLRSVFLEGVATAVSERV